LRFAGIAIEKPPEGAEQHAREPHDDEECSPAEGAGDPEKKGTQEREPEVLAHRVNAGGACPLGLREPHGQDAAVAGIGGSLRDAQRQTRADQRGESAHHPLKHRTQGPQRDGAEVSQAHSKPVQEDSSGDLGCGIRPREGGERDAHRRRAEPELLRKHRGRHADHRAIQVVDHRAHGDQSEHKEPRASGFCRIQHMDGLSRHAFPPDGDRARLGWRAPLERVYARAVLN
jgi:hypothetical protein